MLCPKSWVILSNSLSQFILSYSFPPTWVYIPILEPGVETSKRIIVPFINYKIKSFQDESLPPPMIPLTCWASLYYGQQLCPKYSLNAVPALHNLHSPRDSKLIHSLFLALVTSYSSQPRPLQWSMLATSIVQGPQTQVQAQSVQLHCQRPPCTQGHR